MSIEFVNVTKCYRSLSQRHVVYNNFSMTIPPYRNVGVIGRNGGGKSTFLKLISGAEKPDTGRIVRHMSVSWPLGFTGFFQSDLSGVANVTFCARLYNRNPHEVVEFVRDWSGLGKFMDWPVKGYSSGMRGRLGFALSLAIEFDCILIDEVLSTGDITFREKAIQALEELQDRSCFIMATHDFAMVERLCDFVVVVGGMPPIISDDVRGVIRQVTRQMREEVYAAPGHVGDRR